MDSVSPIDDLWFASTRGRKQPLYPAGHSQDYSSTNYELLGLILLQHANLTSWALLDQRQAAFRADIAPRFPKTRFALRGLCETYTRVHGYEPDDKYGLNLDTAFLSCTNGYTCGNVVTTAGEVADFVWALYGEASIVSRRSVDAMSDIWEWYGLGTMDLPSYGRAGDAYCRLGHFGVTCIHADARTPDLPDIPPCSQVERLGPCVDRRLHGERGIQPLAGLCPGVGH